ncbi:MAG: hypothetical protein HBSIN02_23850 [Bacteroidia bacterium]|nr:MAG: hypothetical protein HBSIN02_23850 [Bacteroidia bacterium]
MDVKPVSILLRDKLTGDDARGFLAPMLERVQTIVGHDGRFRMAVDSKDSTVATRFSFAMRGESHDGKYEKNSEE